MQLSEFKHNQSSVDAHINLTGKQNMPKVVALIQSIDQLKHIDSTSFNPAWLNEHCFLVTISEIFSSFTNSFININMNMVEQLILLST